MAGYFKKRRGSQGPNKNEQKVLRARNAENQVRLGGAIGVKFPAIKSLKISLTFLDTQKQVLDEKNLTLGPLDAAIFTVPCPGRCGIGSFDFGGKIAAAASARLPIAEGSATCSEPLYAGSTETCGCEIRCRMQLDYLPATAAQ